MPLRLINFRRLFSRLPILELLIPKSLTLRLLTLGGASLLLLGCQAGYLIENGYYQVGLLLSRTANTEAVKSDRLSAEQKAKILLAEEARLFAEKHLGLAKSENYTQFVQLDGPYVVHSLTVAPRDELKPYEWWFPFFGNFPYLGYYSKASADLAQRKYAEQGYDTYLRGVTAFSTLGWFNDPILSSMLRYSDYDLVNTIIHETVHATVYIKNAVDFNERLAVFIGNLGTEKFYLAKEGKNSPTLIEAAKSNADDRLFSQFITQELSALDEWYRAHRGKFTEEERQVRLRRIQEKFADEVLPHLQSGGYRWFTEGTLNNAQLLSFRTYYRDLSEFTKLYQKLGENFDRLIAYCKKLENVENPEEVLSTEANLP